MKNWTNRLVGPAGTVLITIGYCYLSTLWPDIIPSTAAILFPVVAVAAFISGLRAGLVAALWTGAYSAWQLWPADIPRAVVVTASAVALAVVVGVLKRRSRLSDLARRKATAFDEVNGNILRIGQMQSRLFELLSGWRHIPDKEKYRQVEIVYGGLVTLATMTAGWHQLAREKKEVQSGGPTKEH
jgi:heme exporter protein D